jgi:hypothetical protein
MTFSETNRRLHFYLDSIVPRQEQSAVKTPEHVSALLSELLRASAGCRPESIPARGYDLELDERLEECRRNVK